MAKYYTIVVVSDNHGDYAILDKVIKNYPDADGYIHCGDSEMSKQQLAQWLAVAGNNDYGTSLPDMLVWSKGDVRILVLHSHTVSYFQRNQRMAQLAKERNCQIVCFGHTHVFYQETVDQITLINPGSLRYNRDGTQPCFGLLTISTSGQLLEFKRIDADTLL